MGDWIETDPLPTKADAIKMIKAAHFWAWRRQWRVTTDMYSQGDGTYVMRVELVSKHRVREFG